MKTLLSTLTLLCILLSANAQKQIFLYEGKPAGSVILIGHSFGGAIALHMARTRPELFKALVLFEPVAFHLFKTAEPALYQQVQQLSQQIAAELELVDKTKRSDG